MRWIVTSVSVKPSAVCRLSIVPTHGGGESSAIDAENCAESATMLMPHTMHTRSERPGRSAEEQPDRRRAGAADRHGDDGDRRSPDAVGEKAGDDAADGAGADRRERDAAWPQRGPRRGSASCQNSRRERRRSMPTSHRAPTCVRGSRGWRGATARRATRRARAVGSKRGVGLRFGPMLTARISTPANAALTDAAIKVARQSTPPSALNRCGAADPSVSAPTSKPTMKPMSLVAQVAASFIPIG